MRSRRKPAERVGREELVAGLQRLRAIDAWVTERFERYAAKGSEVYARILVTAKRKLEELDREIEDVRRGRSL